MGVLPSPIGTYPVGIHPCSRRCHHRHCCLVQHHTLVHDRRTVPVCCHLVAGTVGCFHCCWVFCSCLEFGNLSGHGLQFLCHVCIVFIFVAVVVILLSTSTTSATTASSSSLVVRRRRLLIGLCRWDELCWCCCCCFEGWNFKGDGSPF